MTIRSYRIQLGLAQEGLAYEADINRSYIASLEAGQRNPSLDLMASSSYSSWCRSRRPRSRASEEGGALLAPCQATFASFVASEWHHALVPAKVKAGSVTAALVQKRSGRSL
jgi:hypothetical protein